MTKRTLGLLIPMPNAMVATMTCGQHLQHKTQVTLLLVPTRMEARPCAADGAIFQPRRSSSPHPPEHALRWLQPYSLRWVLCNFTQNRWQYQHG
jgi:hypothetical protein